MGRPQHSSLRVHLIERAFNKAHQVAAEDCRILRHHFFVGLRGTNYFSARVLWRYCRRSGALRRRAADPGDYAFQDGAVLGGIKDVVRPSLRSLAFVGSGLVQQKRNRLEVTACCLVDEMLRNDLPLRDPLASAVLRYDDSALQLLLQRCGEVFGTALATGRIAGLPWLELVRSRRLAEPDLVGAISCLGHRSSHFE